MYPASHTMAAGIGSSPSATLNWIKWISTGWIRIIKYLVMVGENA